MSPLLLRTRLSALARRLRSRFVFFGTLRHTYPVNPAFGIGHGTPVDRYYVEAFLRSRSTAIRGRVLEIGDREYTTMFGSGVTTSDVLHAEEGNPEATIVGDIANCPQIPDAAFDCIILTQTLHYIYDMEAAVAELHRILAPGGHVLCTVPGISQVSRHDMERWGDRWRLTSLSARELLSTAFEPDRVSVATYGNALTSVCFLEGIVAEKLRPKELDAREEEYQLLVTVDAMKAET
jgi:SAM-dependent methyltransferase